MGTTVDKLSYLMATKAEIKNAIENAGIHIAEDTPFRNYVNAIRHLRLQTAPIFSRNSVNINIANRGYSYSDEEFIQLNEYPPIPYLEDAAFARWNYALSEAKEYVEKYKQLDIGGYYIPKSQKTRIYINLESEDKLPVKMYCASYNESMTRQGTITVDWGDGTIEELNSYYLFHTYQECGKYIITLTPQEGGLLNGVSGNNLLDTSHSNLNPNLRFSDIVTRIDFGNNFAKTGIRINLLSNNTNLRVVNLPPDLEIRTRMFDSCVSLESITTSNSIGDYAFCKCSGLKYVSLPPDLKLLGEECFKGCTSLESISIPETITKLDGYQFSGCTSLKYVSIPEGVTSLSAFSNCSSLEKIVFPSTITHVGGFDGCNNMILYDFRALKQIPTINYISLGAPPLRSGCKIVVPDNLYNDWLKTGYWYTYKEIIIKASDYEG